MERPLSTELLKLKEPTPNALPVIQFHSDDDGNMIAFPGTIISLIIPSHTQLEEQVRARPQTLIGHTLEYEISEENGLRNLSVIPYSIAAFGNVQKIFANDKKDHIKIEIAVTKRVCMLSLKTEKDIMFCDNWETIPEDPPSKEEFATAFFQDRIRLIRSVLTPIYKTTAPGDAKLIPANLFTAELTEKTLGIFVDHCAFLFNTLASADTIMQFLRGLIAEGNVSRRMDLILSLLDYIRTFKDPFSNFFINEKTDKEGRNIPIQGRTQTTKNTKEENGKIKQYQEQYEKIKNLIPQSAQDEIERELERVLSGRQTGETLPAEDHLKLLLRLFSLKATLDNTNIHTAKLILDEDHAGLEKPKTRVLEHLAVHKNAPGNVSILCFVGPPGVGKTSLGTSIARALGRKFVRLSLGGFHDEAEIRGHGITYVRTQPGWMIKKLLEAGSKNPVFMLDEIDKIGRDARGDPAAALLEVLDPEQNKAFLDLSVNTPFDFSEVFFICTANTTSTIPPALKDRMEIIKLSGYTPYEKVRIAKQHLLLKINRRNGFPLPRIGNKDLFVYFTDEAMMYVIEKYTDESGVRKLEQIIEGILRKIALRCEQGEFSTTTNITITPETVVQYTEKSIAYPEHRFENIPSGCVPMFAVSDSGGYFFYVEVALERGRDQRKIKVTGVRGSETSHDVSNLIEESVDVAFDSLMLEGGILHRTNKIQKTEKEYYIHVHVSDSATPKDGPSAGIPILWALYSLLRNKPIQPNLGATGEIDLKLGNIGAVGGIREKALAAYRAGIKKFIIPQDNISDLDEIPKEVKTEIDFLPRKYWWDTLLDAFPDDEIIKSYIAKRSF